jgi:4-hydroxy-4-methyl-2-oxoglutarate aldolase
MENLAPIFPKLLDLLHSVDTCTIANAIETLNIPMRNEDDIQTSLSRLVPSLAPVVGYAVTGRIRMDTPPISNRCYYGKTDWWEYMAQFPSPKIMVPADVDPSPGTGVFAGEIHTEICRAWGCVAYVTNGAIHDVPWLERDSFQCFSSALYPSHVCGDFGESVEIGCQKITRAGVLQGDRHGVQSIPRGIDAHLADAVQTIHADEAELIELCRSPDLSVGKLTAILRKDILMYGKQALSRPRLRFNSSRDNGLAERRGARTLSLGRHRRIWKRILPDEN